MKKSFIFSACFVIAIIGSTYSFAGKNAELGGNQQTKPAQVKKSAPTATVKPAASGKTASADIELGKQLVAKSDCLACHKVQEKLVGPAYADIAKKYSPTPANINLLAQKIINGGSGVWGQIPMSPHPDMKAADADKIVKYILSLK